jgi:outer membrane cobalamin receptor
VRSRALIVMTLCLGAGTPAVAAVTGTVRDLAGSPIEGATVATASRSTSPCSTRSASDGTFELACAEPGAVVHIEAAGFETVDLTATSRPMVAVLSPPSYSESVVVTATRAEEIRTSGAAPVTVLSAAALQLTPPAPLDDALRLVPGFSLFRRTTSRAANPTTQGAGLRGLSASGASRALVMSDGVPLNDPFGGWVYWSRVPVTALDRVEVVRGGASDLYGADALAGVVQVLTRTPEGPGARVDLEAATHTTGRASLYLADARGPWKISGAAETFSTDGYVLVPEDQRGPVDVNATLDYTSARVASGYSSSPRFFVRLTGDVYGEHRGNGTPVQTNSTDIRQLSVNLGGELGGGTWEITGHAGNQSYDQAFSSIAADRTSETLTSKQYVPATQHGVGARWQRSWSSIDLLTGADTRDVSATNIETSFAPSGVPRATTDTPGFQRTSGAYVQVTDRPASSVTFSIGARGDLRQRSRDEGFFGGDSAFSPRASIGWSVSPLVEIRGSLGWAFRAPTLNERYRGFRAGNALTLPNADLLPEFLRSEEGSVLFKPRQGSLRLTVYRNDLTDAVTNVTISSTPSLITRKRENVSSIDAVGVEGEGEWRVTSVITVTGSLAYTHSRFADYAPLDGLRVPQVPDWQGSVGIRGSAPFATVVSAEIRSFGSQFDDDRNTFLLNAGTIVNLTVLRPLGHRASAYVSFENLLNSDYDVGATPVRTIGQPFTLHGGLRMAVGH